MLGEMSRTPRDIQTLPGLLPEGPGPSAGDHRPPTGRQAGPGQDPRPAESYTPSASRIRGSGSRPRDWVLPRCTCHPRGTGRARHHEPPCNSTWSGRARPSARSGSPRDWSVVRATTSPRPRDLRSAPAEPTTRYYELSNILGNFGMFHLDRRLAGSPKHPAPSEVDRGAGRSDAKDALPPLPAGRLSVGLGASLNEAAADRWNRSLWDCEKAGDR